MFFRHYNIDVFYIYNTFTCSETLLLFIMHADISINENSLILIPFGKSASSWLFAALMVRNLQFMQISSQYSVLYSKFPIHRNVLGCWNLKLFFLYELNHSNSMSLRSNVLKSFSSTVLSFWWGILLEKLQLLNK